MINKIGLRISRDILKNYFKKDYSFFLDNSVSKLTFNNTNSKSYLPNGGLSITKLTLNSRQCSRYERPTESILIYNVKRRHSASV